MTKLETTIRRVCVVVAGLVLSLACLFSLLRVTWSGRIVALAFLLVLFFESFLKKRVISGITATAWRDSLRRVPCGLGPDGAGPSTGYPLIPNSTFLLALLLPIASAFGNGTLLAIAILYALFSLNLSKLRFALPFLLVLGGWALAEILREFDWQSYVLLFRGDDGPGLSGIRNIVHFLKISPPNYFLTLQSFIRYFLIFFYAVLFFDHSDLRRPFIKGLLCGLLISSIVALIQWFALVELPLVNQSSYWTSLRRICASFTDPNAYGIFFALSIPLLYCSEDLKLLAKPFLRIVLLVMFSLVGLLSGSRTFILALGLFVLMILYSKNRQIFWKICVAVLLSVVVWNFCIYDHPSLLNKSLSLLPTSLARIIQTLSFSTLEEAFFSRSVFAKIGIAVWLDNPITGLGFNRFRDVVPLYSQSVGANIGMWIDNPNNFYIGILSECGLIGLCALVLTIFQMSFSKQASSCSKYSLLLLGLLLLTGPHLDFDEVAILAAFLLSQALDFSQAKGNSLKIFTIFSLVLFFVVLASGLTERRGFYGVEKEREHFHRWTSRVAEDSILCSADLKAGLQLRPIVPVGYQKPFSFTVYSKGNVVYSKDLVTTPATPLDVPLTCSKAGEWSEYRIEVLRPWSPWKFGYGADARLLGIQIAISPLK